MRKFNLEQFLLDQNTEIINSANQRVEIIGIFKADSDKPTILCRTYRLNGESELGTYNSDGEPIFNGLSVDKLMPNLYFKPIEKVGYVNLYLSETNEGRLKVVTGSIFVSKEYAEKCAERESSLTYLKTVEIPYFY